MARRVLCNQICNCRLILQTFKFTIYSIIVHYKLRVPPTYTNWGGGTKLNPHYGTRGAAPDRMVVHLGVYYPRTDSLIAVITDHFIGSQIMPLRWLWRCTLLLHAKPPRPRTLTALPQPHCVRLTCLVGHCKPAIFILLLLLLLLLLSYTKYKIKIRE